MATAAQAQSYPSRTITIVVTAAAGGVTDVVARAVGQRLSEKWGQQVVVENKGGGAHVVGAQQVANAAPDGHTLMLAEAGTFVINPATSIPRTSCRSTSKRISSPITGLVRIHHSVMVAPKPAGEQRRRADRARQAEAGRDHLRHRRHRLRPACQRRALRERGEASSSTPIHYRGAAPALNDVMAGHINMMIGERQPRAAAPPRRQDQDARHRQREAAAAASRHSDRRRRPATCRALRRHLVRPVRSPPARRAPIVDKINADVRSDPSRARRSRSSSWSRQFFETMGRSPEEFRTSSAPRRELGPE